jgi:tetratricopeptide (TPR) repeat protein
VVAGLALFAAACGPEKDPGAELKARADELFAAENYEAAARLYQRILDDYPEWAEENGVAEAHKKAEAKSYFTAARKYARSGRQDLASDALDKAYELLPGDVEVVYGVGWVYIEKALEYRNKAAMTSGAGRADYGLLAEAHAELAREKFEKCVELDATHWGGHRGLAVYYLFGGENDKALEALAEAEKCSKKDDDKINVARLRFRAYAAKNDFDEGKKVLDELIEEYPNRGEVYFALGEYYLLLEKPNIEEAKNAFETGVTKEFEDSGTRNQMYIMLSRLRMREGDYEGAASAVKAALDDDPFNEIFTDEYAVAWGTKKLAEKR